MNTVTNLVTNLVTKKGDKKGGRITVHLLVGWEWDEIRNGWDGSHLSPSQYKLAKFHLVGLLATLAPVHI